MKKAALMILYIFIFHLISTGVTTQLYFLCVSLAVRTNLSFGDDFSRGERLLKEEQNNSTPKNKEQRVVIVWKHRNTTNLPK